MAHVYSVTVHLSTMVCMSAMIYAYYNLVSAFILFDVFKIVLVTENKNIIKDASSLDFIFDGVVNDFVLFFRKRLIYLDAY